MTLDVLIDIAGWDAASSRQSLVGFRFEQRLPGLNTVNDEALVRRKERGIYRGDITLSAYSANKPGLAIMAQALARDLAPRGITVTTVHLGLTANDMSPATNANAAGQVERTALSSASAHLPTSPLRVAYLAALETAAVTDSAIVVDDGANA